MKGKLFIEAREIIDRIDQINFKTIKIINRIGKQRKNIFCWKWWWRRSC